jgi:DNA (cytosine-5)-methyltransferase 1
MKPDYTVPTMDDVARLRSTNGYRMISTFSGAGGACLGFEMAGFDVLYASEFVEAARETYAANHPGVPIDPRDIRDVTGQDILDQVGLKSGELDLLEGSPPCASFSTAGKRDDLWGKTKQYSDRTQVADDLFFEFARIVGEIQPRVFVAENVSGLVKGKAKGYFKLILRALHDQGYNVKAKLLDASWLGVPQSRVRLIFIGVRNDLGLDPVFPKPLPYRYSVREVLPSITHLKYPAGSANRGETYVEASRPSPTLVAADARQSATAGFSTGGYVVTQDEITHDPETGKLISLGDYAIGKAWDRTPQGGIDVKYYSLIKPRLDEPSPTITATAGQVGAAGVVHPTQRRKYTLEELRLLSSFPADFVLTGNYERRWERVGRSVPPLMARAIGETIRDEILGVADGK